MLKEFILLILLRQRSNYGVIIYETNDWTDFKDVPYHVSFKYPKTWKNNPEYRFRYGDTDGYFSFDAISGNNLTLDQVAELDTSHLGNPYGTKPKITNETIAGQPAKLILPSSDQPQITANQAGLIVTYPTLIEIEGISFSYFILWAHKDYILPIARTIRFI